jgi:hypothetical protein
VKTLNRLGGLLFAAALVVAVVIGFQTPTGRAIWDGLWQATATVVRFGRQQVGRIGTTPVAGNLWAAIGIAAVAFLITLALVPPLRAGRGFAFLAVAFTVLAFVLYQPSILSGIGG